MTTVDERTDAVAALLEAAEAAHGVYETTVLDGVYDQAWPAWYAAYAVEHGIGGHVGRAVSVDELGRFLATTFDAFKAADPAPSEAWPAWTARRIVMEL